FMATSRYYADFMAPYLGLPRDRIAVIYPGLKLSGHAPRTASHNGAPFTIGYFARICPEKGFHQLIDAFIELKRLNPPPCRLRVSGWLGDNNKDYFEEQKQKLRSCALLEDFEHFESPDHMSKVRFLQSLDVLSVPTVYHEPKGLYVLEAWANGVAVVQPRHGSFSELIEAAGGGLLRLRGDPPPRWRGAVRHFCHPRALLP